MPDQGRFNEAAGTDPADAIAAHFGVDPVVLASMRPRGQTPRMRLRHEQA